MDVHVLSKQNYSKIIISPPGAAGGGRACFAAVTFDNGRTDRNADCCINTGDENLLWLKMW